MANRMRYKSCPVGILAYLMLENLMRNSIAGLGRIQTVMDVRDRIGVERLTRGGFLFSGRIERSCNER